MRRLYFVMLCTSGLGMLGCSGSDNVGSSGDTAQLAQELAQAKARLKSLERKQASLQADLFPIYQLKPHADKAVATVQAAVKKIETVMESVTAAEGQLMTAQAEIKTAQGEIESLKQQFADFAKQSQAEHKKLFEKDASLDKQDIAILSMMKSVEESARQQRTKLQQNGEKTEDAGKADGQDSTPATVSFNALLKSVETVAKEERGRLDRKDAALDLMDVELRTLLESVDALGKTERQKLVEADAKLAAADEMLVAKDKSLNDADVALNKRDSDIEAKLSSVERAAKDARDKFAKESNQQDLDMLAMFHGVERTLIAERRKLAGMNTSVPVFADEDAPAKSDKDEKPSADASFDQLLDSVRKTTTKERLDSERAYDALVKEDARLKASVDELAKTSKGERDALDARIQKLSEQDLRILSLVKTFAAGEQAEGNGAGKKEETDDANSTDKGAASLDLDSIKSVLSRLRGLTGSMDVRINDENATSSPQLPKPDDKAQEASGNTADGQPSKSFDELLKSVKKATAAQRDEHDKFGAELAELIKTLQDKDVGLLKQVADVEKRLKALEQIKVIKSELSAEKERTTDLVSRFKILEMTSKLLREEVTALAAIDNNQKDPPVLVAGEILTRKLTIVDAKSQPILSLDGRVPKIEFHPADAKKRVRFQPGLYGGSLTLESENGRYLFLSK